MRETWKPDSRLIGRTARAALRAVIAAGLFQAIGAPPPAAAATFSVTARILCPGSWLVGPESLDPTYMTAVNVPCAGIRVSVMDADPGFDEHCGTAYTDARGRVLIQGDCGDAIRPAPDVYLRIEGKSLNRFSVGVIAPDLLETLTQAFDLSWERFAQRLLPTPVPELESLLSHETFAWVTRGRTEVREGGALDFGDQIVGGVGTSPVSVMAGRQFWAVQYAMFRLDAGTRYRPMPFEYTVNAPLPPFTAAFTAYDHVVVDLTRTPPLASPAALVATPHEIGHVLHNTYHGNRMHWVDDCADIFCFRPHMRCVTESQKQAWYEGFGNFVRDYVHQQWNWQLWRWTTAAPPPGCALEAGPMPVDMSVEGNVEGLLNNVFYGPVRRALLDAANPTAGGLSFGCPDGAPPVDGPAGSLECEVLQLATCATGNLMVDADGDRDQCLDFVENPRCANAPNHDSPNFSCPYDPVPQTNTPFCADRVARSGRDACAIRVPAFHSLPNGRPRPRPDGTPDMTLGATSSGENAWFSLPALDDVIGWIDTAGTDDHRASDYWTRRIRPWCVRGDGSLRDRYCHPLRSPSFFGELSTLDPALN